MKLSIVYTFLLIAILAMPSSISAQKSKIDSLYTVLKTEKEDTNRVNTLNSLSERLRGGGNYDSALTSATSAQTLGKELGYKKGQAEGFRNTGLVFYRQGNYSAALENYFKSLKIKQEIGNQADVASIYGNIGGVYWNQGNFTKALEYCIKTLNIYQTLGNKDGIARSLGNIGIVYKKQGNFPKALEYDFKALEIDEKIGDKDAIAIILGNLGNVYYSQGRYAESLEYDLKALNIEREIGDKDGLAMSYSNIGETYTHKKDYAPAIGYLDSALVLSNNIGDKYVIEGAYNCRAELDSATGNYKQGLEDYKKYIVYRDSVTNEENTKKTVQTEMNYEFTRKTDSTRASQEKQAAIAEKESQRQKVIRNSFMGGFALTILLIFFIYRGYRQKLHQTALVEEKNREIVDSITYSKRLQDAILPPISVIKKYLPESFLLYKPKDIVAGDFYWMERIGDNILIAACDSTGHGVPGAIVSIVCSNALNRTVKEFHISEPGKILDKVRELVIETFEKSESEVQDGMDISLCCINTQSREIQWSGAYNPLWYIQNNELKELAPDKQPIGMFDQPKPFNTATLKLEKGNTLYLFTDGYADQFGGPKGKKFMSKQFQEKLLSIATLGMDKQREALDNALETWKGNLEQVDDVLIIGIRV